MITVSKGGTTLASTTSSQEELVGALGVDVAEVQVEDTNAAPAATTETEEESAAAEIASESETEQQDTEQQRDETGKFKPRGGFQKKIDKLTRRASDLQATLEEERLARQRLEAQLAGRAPAAEAAKAEAKAEIDAEPDEDKPNPKTGKPWTDWKEFSREYAAWSYRQAQKDASAETTKQTEQSELKQKFDAHVGRVKAAQEKYDDWDTAAAALQGDDAQIPEAAGLAIIELDNGADVLYHLAKHPELRTKLRGMSDVRAVAEIGRLAATLPADDKTTDEAKKAAAAAAATESPTPKPRSSAPAPIRPVGGANANSTPDPMKLPLADYIKRRNKGDVR